MEENIQPQNLTSEPEAPVGSKKSFKKWILIGIILILILSLSLGGYLLLNKMGIKPSTSTVTLKTTNPTSTPDPTANWKTYTNTKYNYSFKYPGDWKLDLQPYAETELIEHLDLNSPLTQVKGKSMIFNISFNVEKKPIAQPTGGYDFNIDTVYNSNLNKNLFVVISGIAPGELIGYPSGSATHLEVTDQKILINKENEGLGFDIKGANLQVSIWGQYFSQEDNSRNQINLSGREYLAPSVFKAAPEYKIFKQILSTFKFTNQTANSSPTCKPRPACLDTTPKCMIPETSDMCPKTLLKISEYGVQVVLTDNIKDAYYVRTTADKGYVYLKVHALDSESQCKKDDSSTAALSRVGKDDINPMSQEKYSSSYKGTVIGNYFYYIDLAQYSCAESASGKTLLEKVRTAFANAEITQ